ncbi:MAG: metalloregulator ArsR/SmtB family transcription factor [Pyrinomonadaceae bacterium]|nr:metalloregulator ArsR/SmtB family transcription factor [Pyrinomonadaceae bacterium]
MSKTNLLQDLETFYTALADKTRLRLLNLIRDEEVCVCFFVEALGESQPKISRHLAYLRKAGLVSTRKEGKWVHYKMVPPESPHIAEILSETLECLKTQTEMQQEHERLVEACLTIEMPVTIAKAPKPDTFAETDLYVKEDVEVEELETYLL